MWDENEAEFLENPSRYLRGEIKVLKSALGWFSTENRHKGDAAYHDAPVASLMRVVAFE